jgi:hypothetical protein
MTQYERSADVYRIAEVNVSLSVRDIVVPPLGGSDEFASSASSFTA